MNDHPPVFAGIPIQPRWSVTCNLCKKRLTENNTKCTCGAVSINIPDEDFKRLNSPIPYESIPDGEDYLKPNLGCATTLELIMELAARADVANTIGEKWPTYRTVDS